MYQVLITTTNVVCLNNSSNISSSSSSSSSVNQIVVDLPDAQTAFNLKGEIFRAKPEVLIVNDSTTLTIFKSCTLLF